MNEDLLNLLIVRLENSVRREAELQQENETMRREKVALQNMSPATEQCIIMLREVMRCVHYKGTASRIDAIKALREATGCGLKEAKDAVVAANLFNDQGVFRLP